MGFLASIPIDEIRQRGSIRDGDVALFRAAYDEASGLTAAEADALFQLHAASPIQDPTWSRFFIDVITDYVVNQAPPEGYVVAENARWLRDQVSTFGRVETTTELSLLVHVLETARWTPPSLAAFALDQIRHAIETGAGPLRPGREPARNITPHDVDLAGRIIRAFGGETSIPVTRSEAGVLIAINRAIAAGLSSPAWSTLFVRAVGSAVLAATGHAIPSRRDLIDAATTPSSSSTALIDLFLGTSAQRSADAFTAPQPLQVWRTARVLTNEERALTRLERQRLEIVTNEVIEDATDEWLIEQLSDASGDDQNEAALIAYIMREAGRPTTALTKFAALRRIAA